MADEQWVPPRWFRRDERLRRKVAKQRTPSENPRPRILSNLELSEEIGTPSPVEESFVDKMNTDSKRAVELLAEFGLSPTDMKDKK